MSHFAPRMLAACNEIALILFACLVLLCFGCALSSGRLLPFDTGSLVMIALGLDEALLARDSEAQMWYFQSQNRCRIEQPSSPQGKGTWNLVLDLQIKSQTHILIRTFLDGKGMLQATIMGLNSRRCGAEVANRKRNADELIRVKHICSRRFSKQWGKKSRTTLERTISTSSRIGDLKQNIWDANPVRKMHSEVGSHSSTSG